jgi:hypothetical protein
MWLGVERKSRSQVAIAKLWDPFTNCLDSQRISGACKPRLQPLN